MEINEIKVTGKPIPEINIFDPAIPQVFTGYPMPVTVDIGFPVVDIPGCVETRESNDLREVDPRGNMVLCDGQVPSYNPPNFEPNQMLPTQRPKVDTKQPKPPEAPDLPIPKTPPATAKVDCPTPAQQAKEPVGTYIEGFRKKVTDYQLVGNQCIQITEPVPIPEQIIAGLPSPGAVMTTGGIAVVATASALMAKPLADILLKVIKPTVKKVMKKIAAIRGKSVPVLSVAERQDLQRERSHAIRELRKVLKPKG
jgi:hypothetical protein